MKTFWNLFFIKKPLSRLRTAFHTGRYKKVKAMIGEGRTLDIGCGKPCEHMPDQAFLRFLDKDNSVGLDIEERKGPYEFHKGNITSMPFKDGEFDNVVAMEILEHITDISKALAEIKRVLKPKGILVMSTPDNSLLWKTIWEIWSATAGRMWHHKHQVSYNSSEWRNFLEEHFEQIELKRQWRFDLIFRGIPRLREKR